MAKPKAPIATNDLLGTIEQLVLIAVTRLEDAYGMSVYEALREAAYPDITFGSVYTALERLTWKGYLIGELGEPEPTRGGRARKYYRATALGEAVLASTRNAFVAAELIGRASTVV